MLDTDPPRCATFRTSAEKHYGFGDPESDKAQQPRPHWTAAFLLPTDCAWRTASFMAGRVGTPARVCRYLIPVRQPDTVCHLHLAMNGAGFEPVDKGSFMANTTLTGRIAPAYKPTTGNPPQFDLVALHGEAINACSMATYYTRKGNHAGAARKSVQALAALRRLQAAGVKADVNPCATCPDNFALPVPQDYFDQVVVSGYVARRAACDKCPVNLKPRLAVAGDLEENK